MSFAESFEILSNNIEDYYLNPPPTPKKEVLTVLKKKTFKKADKKPIANKELLILIRKILNEIQ